MKLSGYAVWYDWDAREANIPNNNFIARHKPMQGCEKKIT